MTTSIPDIDPRNGARLLFGSKETRTYVREVVIGDIDGTRYATLSFLRIAVVLALIVALMPGYPSYFLWLFPIYFLICNGAEYALHRYPMHHKMEGMEVVYEHVSLHHNFFANDHYYYEEPRDYLAVTLPTPIFLMLTATVAVVSGLIWLVGNRESAMFFALVGYTYYFLYELMHFSYHASEDNWVKKLPFVKTLSRLHLLHHRTKLMARYNFNITFPVCDKVFGTLYNEPAVTSGNQQPT